MVVAAVRSLSLLAAVTRAHCCSPGLPFSFRTPSWFLQAAHHPGSAPTLAHRRTFKYLQGVLGAKWVLEEGWLAACLEQGGAAAEAAFQVWRAGVLCTLKPPVWELRHPHSARSLVSRGQDAPPCNLQLRPDSAAICISTFF